MLKKVIVVDDDYGSSQLIKMLLEMDGFEVSTCATADEAIALSGAEVGAYVVDFYLAEDQSGFELLHSLRAGKTNAHRETPVIVVSGDVRRKEEALEAGADYFLLKPYSPSDLTEQLGLLMAKEKKRA